MKNVVSRLMRFTNLLEEKIRHEENRRAPSILRLLRLKGLKLAAQERLQRLYQQSMQLRAQPLFMLPPQPLHMPRLRLQPVPVRIRNRNQ